jgi:signal transduction histidine kinase/HAMP domain-containing protein
VIVVLTRLRDLPLRVQLMLAFAFLSITTTVVLTIALTTISGNRLQAELRDRSVRIARRLQLQLEPIVASNDRLAAHTIFASYLGDRELDGIAVYAPDGSLIEGTGVIPERLSKIAAGVANDDRHVVATADLKSHQGGPSGRVYLSFSTRANDTLQRHDLWIASSLGGGVALCALILAVQISRRMARRLVRIADAANRIATGAGSRIPLDDRAKDEIGALAHSFNFMVAELNRLALDHELLVSSERERLEHLVLDRTRALEQSREMYRLMAESTKAIPFILDITHGRFSHIGPQAIAAFGFPEFQWKESGALDVIIPRQSNLEVRMRFDECESGSFECMTPLVHIDGRRTEVRWTGTCEWVGGAKMLRGLMLDITEVRRRGLEVAASQKLESVGRLAAGVAHEINTPVQFVTDNVQFVRTSMIDIAPVVLAYRALQQAVQSQGDVIGAAQRAAQAEITADLDYILENAPAAIESSIEGLGRIATIVRSMKEFAHPDQGVKQPADLNQAIRSTLVVAHNEYKYVAEIDAQLGDLPLVPCHLGEINQVILNLLVNASHAIADVVKDTGNLGKLTVRSGVDGEYVEISISDTGMGIPEAVRAKIFDPFFTTKEVGKGTGQGLAIARSVIVNKHSGTLRFETECNKGTTFFIRLPIGAMGAAPIIDKIAA